jgi:DnaJ-domain-containing protein 1
VTYFDPSIGSDGMTRQQRAIVGAVARILGQVAVHSGPSSKEWHHARSAVINFSDGLLTATVADQWLANLGVEVLPDGAPQREDLITDKRDRLVLLRVAVEVAVADGALSAAERSALGSLAARLRLTPDELDHVISSLANVGTDGRAISPEVSQAYELLGLKPGASAAEIRRRYKELMLESHPDLVEEGEREGATRSAAQINAAHDLLVGGG